MSHFKVSRVPQVIDLSSKCFTQIPELFVMGNSCFLLQNLTHAGSRCCCFSPCGHFITVPGFDTMDLPLTRFLWLVVHPATEHVFVIFQENWAALDNADCKKCCFQSRVKLEKKPYIVLYLTSKTCDVKNKWRQICPICDVTLDYVWPLGLAPRGMWGCILDNYHTQYCIQPIGYTTNFLTSGGI